MTSKTTKSEVAIMWEVLKKGLGDYCGCDAQDKEVRRTAKEEEGLGVWVKEDQGGGGRG